MKKNYGFIQKLRLLKHAWCLCGAIFLNKGADAQDLNFTQFYELPLLRNPALAGVFNGDVRVQTVFRNQWQSVTVPYRTMGASAEVVFPLDDYGQAITIGTQLLHDVAGDAKLKRTHILPVLAYRTPLTSENTFITGAIMGGMVSSSFDQAAIRWADQYQNGSYNSTNATRQVLNKTATSYFDLGAGLSISSVLQDGVAGYAGVGLFHANQPQVGFNNDAIKLGRKWSFNAGLTVNTSDYSRLNFYGDYLMQQASTNASGAEMVGELNVFMAGVFYTYDFDHYDVDQPMSFSMGAIYRMNDAVAPMVRLDLKNFAIGMSYDANVSQLSIASGARGGFEITFAYLANLNARWQFTQHPSGCNVGFRGRDIIRGAERKMRRK
jgi:type IX secretion system PorP/SprF family membrane protein